ncbi:HEPN domain-containing protein [Pararhodospirillum oryzae]|uniref:RiboL-PSP-HEPN domain-containing protein n=1 Tax=Pararhodospirillum oryzae TaxID=478448 RepID=A0A512H7Y0_9PROT|nr:HEPN domain-containing protein [Pararhodospirillum oryzae]GEO81566.1 hypothetical protein ROR02_16970 [Pararhodospirillum oryzae]
MHSAVEKMHGEFSELIRFLDDNMEISLRVFVDDTFRKSLLLCVASFFEKNLSNIVENYVKKTSENNLAVVCLVKNKAINRQYHTWFNWNENNANSFFGLFGDDFKNFMKEKTKNDEQLRHSIKSFMEIGSERNRLVHENYGAYTLEKTSEEIFLLYKSSIFFLESIECCLDEFGRNTI